MGFYYENNYDTEDNEDEGLEYDEHDNTNDNEEPEDADTEVYSSTPQFKNFQGADLTKYKNSSITTPIIICNSKEALIENNWHIYILETHDITEISVG